MIDRPFRKTAVRRLLVRSTNWIGDAVMTTPAVRALRLGLPRARITMLAKPWVAPVFDASPHVDEVMVYDEGGRHGGTLGTLRLAADIRRRRFDAAVLLQNAFEAAFLAAAGGIPVRAGLRTDGRRLLLTHGVNRTRAVTRVHQTRYYLHLTTALGIPSRGAEPELFLPAAARRQAMEILRRNGANDGRPLVGINPSATFGAAKMWLPERFARLADRLQEDFDARILLFGGPGDRRLGATVSGAMKRRPIDLAGRTSLPDAMGLIDRCDLFVTNDSGLMHVAAARDVPLVAVFGPTDPVATGPTGDRSRVVRVPHPCSPCLKPVCPIDHRCMHDITVDRVYRPAARLLETTGTDRAATGGEAADR